MKKKSKLLAFILVVIMLLPLIPTAGLPALAIDDYPQKWKDAPTNTIRDDWGRGNRYCDSWVVWCLVTRNGYKWDYSISGDWAESARKAGIKVDNTPAVGSVAMWYNINNTGQGHVAWIAEVRGDYITIEDYNYIGGKYNMRILRISNSGINYFIHFKDIKSTGSYYSAPKMINHTGNVKVLLEAKLDDIFVQEVTGGIFYEGLVAVHNKNYKWGYMDKTGKIVVPCMYDSANRFNEGLAAVLKDGKWGILEIEK